MPHRSVFAAGQTDPLSISGTPCTDSPFRLLYLHSWRLKRLISLVSPCSWDRSGLPGLGAHFTGESHYLLSLGGYLLGTVESAFQDGATVGTRWRRCAHSGEVGWSSQI